VYLRAFRAGVRQYYWEYLKQIGATDDQMKRFTDIMTKWREEWTDVRAAANTTGTMITSADVETLDQKNTEARNAALRALFGPTTPESLQDYRNTFTQRDLVATVAASTFSIKEPMSRMQSAQLVKLVTDSKIEARVDAERSTVVYPNENDYDLFFRRASSFLAPSQVEVLRDTMSRQREMGDRLRSLQPTAH